MGGSYDWKIQSISFLCHISLIESFMPRFKTLGVKPPRGVLLYGPPGVDLPWVIGQGQGFINKLHLNLSNFEVWGNCSSTVVTVAANLGLWHSGIGFWTRRNSNHSDGLLSYWFRLAATGSGKTLIARAIANETGPSQGRFELKSNRQGNHRMVL